MPAAAARRIAFSYSVKDAVPQHAGIEERRPLAGRIAIRVKASQRLVVLRPQAHGCVMARHEMSVFYHHAPHPLFTNLIAVVAKQTGNLGAYRKIELRLLRDFGQQWRQVRNRSLSE